MLCLHLMASVQCGFGSVESSSELSWPMLRSTQLQASWIRIQQLMLDGMSRIVAIKVSTPGIQLSIFFYRVSLALIDIQHCFRQDNRDLIVLQFRSALTIRKGHISYLVCPTSFLTGQLSVRFCTTRYCCTVHTLYDYERPYES